MKNLLLFISLLIIFILNSCQDMTQEMAGSIQTNPTLTTFGSTPLPKDQQIWFWADADQTPVLTDYFKAWLLTVADDQGNLTSDTKQQFPKDNKTPIDLYGMHGDFDQGQIVKNQTKFPSPPNTNGLKFKVETDQSKINDQGIYANHEVSDLLYGIKKSVSPTKDAIKIPFFHMLCNVGVVLRPGKDSPLTKEELQDAKVWISGTKITATFTPDKTISEEDLENDPSKRATMITGLGEETASIRIKTQTVDKNDNFDKETATYGQAIIIPQDAPAEPFIKVELKDGPVLTYTLPEKTQPFTPGTYYRYNVTISDTLSVECSDSQWENGQSEDGTELILEGCRSNDWNDGGSKNVKNLDVGPDDLKIGDYLYISPDGKSWATSDGGYRHYTDGSSQKLTVPTDPDKGTCIGVVVQVGRDGIDQEPYCLKNSKTPMTQFNGYAMALFDAHDTENEKILFTWAQGDVLIYTDLQTNKDVDAYCGYSNTNLIIEYDKSLNKNSDLETDFPACYWATQGYETSYTNNEGDHTAPPNTSGWFLASPGQWVHFFHNRSIFDSSLLKAGKKLIEGFYWSSSEGPPTTEDPKHVGVYEVDSRNSTSNEYPKISRITTRPILVF